MQKVKIIITPMNVSSLKILLIEWQVQEIINMNITEKDSKARKNLGQNLILLES